MVPSATSGCVPEFVNCNSPAFAHAELCDWSALDSSLESVSTAGPHVSRSAKFRKSMAQTCSEDNQNWRCCCWVELLVFRNALKWTKGQKHLPKVFVLFVRIPACHVSLPVRYWLKTIWLFLMGHLFKWQTELDLLGQRRAFCTQICHFWSASCCRSPFLGSKEAKVKLTPTTPAASPGLAAQAQGILFVAMNCLSPSATQQQLSVLHMDVCQFSSMPCPLATQMLVEDYLAPRSPTFVMRVKMQAVASTRLF